MTKTPKSHYERFKREILRLKKLWGISDWQFYFSFGELPSDVQARCIRSLDSRKISFRYNNINPEGHTDTVELCARHEMIHVLVGELGVLAVNRFVQETEIESAEETIVSRLLNILKYD